ncbi:STAS domain-containing protein [Tistrella mobilis]|uniref:STAS domain-containing protein n=1 Tax=Tistrella mobilis TaxID=171437 RepID=UPI00355695FC
MQISVQKSDDAVTRIVLEGRLDVAGSATAELPVSTACGAATNVIVDMTGVAFLASIGIRLLLANAKTVTRRGGRMVLVGVQDQVGQTITMSGLADLLPMVEDEDAARRLIAG